jgi:hypothetical protein
MPEGYVDWLYLPYLNRQYPEEAPLHLAGSERKTF